MSAPVARMMSIFISIKMPNLQKNTLYLWLFLFPSFLHHGVDKKKGTNTRISLSFNVFMKGKIGVKEQLTELVLE